MTTPRIAKAMDYIDDDLVSGAVDYKRTKKKNSWMKWGAMAACLCLVVAIAIPIINHNNQTANPLSGGILAEVIEIVEDNKCKVEVTGADDNLSNGDIVLVIYSNIRHNSEVTDKQLEVGSSIAITYDKLVESENGYVITVPYIEVIEPVGGECLELPDIEPTE